MYHETNVIISTIAIMKREIEEIKTHFSTKADMIKWTVGVGVATILSVAGIIWNLDSRLTQDMREMRQAITSLSQEIRMVSKETKQEIAMLARETKQEIATLARETKQDIAALSQETKKDIAALSKKIDEQNRK